MADNNSRTLTANFTADTSGFSPKINELVQKLKSASQEFEQNKTKITALKTEMKTYQKELEQLNTKQRSNGTLTAEEKQRMQELRDKIAACATELGTYNSAQRQLSANMNSLNRQLSEARDGFNGTGQAAATFGDILKANIASDVVMSGIRKLIDGLRQASAYCYDVGSKFEAGMSKVAAVSGASADDLERLTEKAKDLGASTKFTASETAEAMNYMAMAGWKTEEMLSGIDGVLDLAAASGTDLATTSDIVTDALTAFGMTADDCAHFADVLAAASSNANTNVSMMGETFRYCAPIAGALGFKAEDVAVGIGLMANAGVKATNAGTAMRKFMTELSEGLTITGEKIGEVTIQTSNADGSMRSYAEILGELRGVFAQLTDSEKSAAAKDIVGQNALSGFLAMMNASEADVNKLTSAIQNCDGAAANMAETMENNVQGAVTKMNSALEGVGIAVYDKFKDGLLDAVNIFTETLGNLKNGIDGGELENSVGALANSFRNLASEFAGYINENLDGFIKGLSNVLSFFTNLVSTIGNFHVEIGSAIKALITFKASFGFMNSVLGIAKKVASAVVDVTQKIKGATTASEAFKAVLGASHPVITAISAAASVAAIVISEISGHSKKAAESMDDLRKKSEELSQSVADYKEKADNLSDIKKQYEEIEKSLDPDVNKSQALKDLQDKLISQFPDLSGQIDLVSGSYNEMANEIQGVIDKTNDLSKSDATAAYNKMKAAEEKEKEIEYAEGINKEGAFGYKAIDYSVKQDKRVKEIFKSVAAELGNVDFTQYELSPNYDFVISGDTEEKLKAYETLVKEFEDSGLATDGGKISEYYNQLVELKNQYKEIADNNRKIIDDYESLNKSDDAPVQSPQDKEKFYREQYGHYYGEDKQEEEQRKKDLEKLKEEYDKEKELADDMYSVGELSAEEYYNKLVELRDTYLEKGTHDWYSATAKIQQLYKDMTKDTSKTQKNALSETEMAYKKTLAAIDAEIEQHNRKKSDKEYEKKIADIDEQMTYGRLDEFSKYELEKERKRLQEEREEELFSRNAADAKSSVTDAYNARQTFDKAAEGTKEYTMALGDYTDALEDLSGVLKGVSEAFSANPNSSTNVTNQDNSTQNQYVNVVLEAVNKSNGQLVEELIKALSARL